MTVRTVSKFNAQGWDPSGRVRCLPERGPVGVEEWSFDIRLSNLQRAALPTVDVRLGWGAATVSHGISLRCRKLTTSTHSLRAFSEQEPYYGQGRLRPVRP